MNIHEYQAKGLLKQYGVPVPEGSAATTPEEAVDAAKALLSDDSPPVWVMKAQIHASGRDKGGGVAVVTSLEEIEAEARRMIGMRLVTPQTPPEGQQVKRVYIEKGTAIKRKFSLALQVDRATCRVAVMAMAQDAPDKILKAALDPVTGMQPHHGRRIAFGLGLKNEQIGECVTLLQNLYKAFVELDCTLIAVNPLAVTDNDALVALNCKMAFDDSALFRHPNIAFMRDESEEDPAELLASRNGLNYIKLDGNIGCMVNGAGLAMATMDFVKRCGGRPANFLDVSGSATQERIATGFKIILSDKNVRGIFVNIFGGIMRCDIIAGGIVAAAKDVQLRAPLVVRLEGTNVELGRKILAESGLPIQAGDTLADGAKKIVQAVAGTA